MGCYHLNSKSNTRAVRNIREYHGMRVIKKGYKHCLRCDNVFISEDVKRQYMCPACRSQVKDYQL